MGKKLPFFRCLFMVCFCFALMMDRIQAQCNNADFSAGNFTGWTGTWSDGLCTSGVTGVNCSCSLPEPFQNPGIIQGPNNASLADSAHQSVMTGGYDSIVNGNILSVVWPGGSGKSARLGNAYVALDTSSEYSGYYADAETMSRTFVVTPENSLFIYHDAIVIADGGHPPGQQAYFQVKATTSSGNAISSAAYYVDGTTCHTVGGFSAVPNPEGSPYIYYKRWATTSINLYDYIGQTVTITFITSCCQPGGCAGTHFAYAYLSCECDAGPVPPVVSSSPYVCDHFGIKLTAPASALSYNWSGPGITAGGDTNVVTVDTAGLYIVRMLFPDSIVLFDSINIQGAPVLTSIANSICSGDTFSFNGKELTAPGVYIDTLTTINTGCDSIITLTLTVIPNVPATISITSNPPNPCNGESVTFTAVSNTVNANYIYLKNGNVVDVLNTDSIYSSTVVAGDVWQVKLEQYYGCYSNSYALSNSITIGNGPHQVTISSTAIGCQAEDTLIAKGNFDSSETLMWYRDSLVATNSATDSFYSNAVAGTYFVQVRDSNGCLTNSASVSVLTDTAIITIATTKPACPDSTSIFTASPVYSPSAATYQWKVNGVNTGINSPVFSSSALTNGDTISCILTTNAICGNMSTATSNTIVITADSLVTPTFHITSNGPTICQGTLIFINSSNTNAGSVPTYRWYLDDSLVYTTTSGTQTGLGITNLNNSASVYAVIIPSGVCSTLDSVISNTIHFTVNPLITPALTLTESPVGAICASESVTFTPHPVNGGTFPIYHWYKNGAFVAANTGNYTFSSLHNNDVIRCVLISGASCLSADSVYSNPDTISVYTTPGITINGPSSVQCQGTGIVFSSTVTNAGSTPTYQWRMNGTNIPGATGQSYSFTVLNDTDTFTCLVSSSGCPVPDTVLSNAITINGYSNTLPSVTITSEPSSPVCAGTSVLFSASVVNGGPSPDYEWYANNQLVQLYGSNYNISSITAETVVYCEVMKGACNVHPVATSNSITYMVNPNVIPSVTIQRTPGGPVCPNTTIIFSATGVNAGNAALYKWSLNGTLTGVNTSTYTDAAPDNGDIVKCTLQSNASCLLSNNPVSNLDTIEVLPNVTPAITIIPLQPAVCAGTTASFTALPTGGGTSPAYQWRVNGVNTGVTSDTFSSNGLATGDSISCLLSSSLACALPATVLSNVIGIQVFTVDTPTVSVSSGYGPIVCAGTLVTFTAASTNAGTDPVYQWLINGVNTGPDSDILSIGSLSNYDTVLCLLSSSNACAVNSVSSNIITLYIAQLHHTNLARSVCAGTSFNFNGTLLSTSGAYYDTLTSAVTGCDSIVTLTLTVNPVIITSESQSVCAGHSYNFNGTQISSAGTYRDTLSSVITGCDSIIVLTLSVGNVVTSSISQSICAGDSYNFNGRILTATGSYSDTFPSSVNGCDSIVTLALTVNPVLSTAVAQTICAGQHFSFNGTMLSGGGIYMDTLASIVTGCDSIVTLTLTVNPVMVNSVSQSVCAGDSYYFNGTQISAGGVYTDTLVSTVTGCDSVVTLTLTINPVNTVSINQSVCAGHSYNFNGTQLSSAGTYRDTLSSVNTGCDSIVTLALSVGNIVTSGIGQSICAGSSYNFNGTILSASGSYSDTLSSSVSGCDSVITLTLTVNQPDTAVLYSNICAGTHYIFFGAALNASGVYADTLSSAITGCDSIVILHLTVNAPITLSLPNDTALCPASQVLLAAASSVATVNWQGGYTNGQTVTVNTTTQFVVTADTLGCSDTGSFTATILPEKVWPGDANEDLVVNNYDILAIGLAYGATGPVRPNASLVWEEQCAPAWADSFSNGTNYAFADCNGDGLINFTDTEAVGLNYSLVHPRGANERSGNLPFIVKTTTGTYQPGDTVTGQVLLGTNTLPATGVYGIAFSIDAGALAKPNTLQINQRSSWMTGVGNALTFSRNTGATTADAAQTRINHTNTSGYGAVADFSFVVDSGAANGSLNVITTSASLCLNNAGDTIGLTALADSVTTIVNGINTLEGFDIAVFPNPTTGVVNIKLTGTITAAPVAEVYDELGQLVLSETLGKSSNVVDLSSFAGGFYFIKITGQNGLIITRKICLTR